MASVTNDKENLRIKKILKVTETSNFPRDGERERDREMGREREGARESSWIKRQEARFRHSVSSILLHSSWTALTSASTCAIRRCRYGSLRPDTLISVWHWYTAMISYVGWKVVERTQKSIRLYIQSCSWRRLLCALACVSAKNPELVDICIWFVLVRGRPHVKTRLLWDLQVCKWHINAKISSPNPILQKGSKRGKSMQNHKSVVDIAHWHYHTPSSFEENLQWIAPSPHAPLRHAKSVEP